MSALADPGLGAPSVADVESIASDVWASAVPGGALPPASGLHREGLAVGAVSISGAWQGWVTLEVPGATATRLTAAMLGGGDVVPAAEDVDDALGELANMIGGNLKSLVPAPSVLGLPVVVADPGELVAAGEEVCRAELCREGAELRVRVWQAANPGETSNTEGREVS